MSQEAVLRCKLRVTQVTHYLNADGEVDSENIKMSAVYAKEGENAHWSKWTPSASFDITINNPEAFGKLTKDHEFYVDFIPAGSG